MTKLNEVIRWPQGHDIVMTIESFRSKQGIPNVLGAIDGTHIRIEKPAAFEQDYCNRKKFFSISLQIVADANMRITNVHCGEPGSLHDARIFRRSELYHAANADNGVLFPKDTFSLGDSAYPSLSLYHHFEITVISHHNRQNSISYIHPRECLWKEHLGN